MAGDWAIKAQCLTKRYGSITAVSNLNLEVAKGEIFGLVGPDGAGKTSTIQMLCGISMPTGGSVVVAGVDAVKEAERLGGKIGYMSEGFTLYGTLTIGENIDFFADLYSVPIKLREERKEKLLHFSRLSSFVDRPAEKLSGGMKKKLALCCTLIYSPEILFLDEPTTGVDPVSRREFWKIIYDFLSEGVTVFVSTPYMDEAERCDKVALLHRGEILKYGTPSGLKEGIDGELLSISANPMRPAVSLLKQQAIYSNVQIFGEELHLMVKNTQEESRKISDYLRQNNIDVTAIKKIVPSIEDVFVSSIRREETQKGASEVKVKEKMVTDKIVNKTYSVEVKGLARTFGNFTAVNRINFKVRHGEIFGFLEPNGSGKSTTIRMLCGLLRPTSGQASVAGLDIAKVKEARKLRSRIGYMSQKFSLYNELTAEENIDFYAGVYGLPKKLKKERKDWVLEMAGLAGKERTITGSLSGGWKQRLALGCAILHRPEILFLDEPTSGVDPIARREFWDLIYQLSAQGVTVFITTHYMDEAEHCHNIALIYNGNIIAMGGPGRLKEEKLAGELLEIETVNPMAALNFLTKDTPYRSAALFGSNLHLLVEEAAPVINHLYRLLEKNGFQVRRIEKVTLKMEDLFVALIEAEDSTKKS